MLIKRLFDVIIAGCGFIILLPVFIIIAVLIKCDSSGSIFFRQVRVGRNGVHFRIHKFRTMVENAEEIGLAITIGADTRITKIGNILRRYKLDELPQLIDVIRGDMSLVGPRPEVPEYVNKYPAEIKRIVLSVRPGISDNASIMLIHESALLAKSHDPQTMYNEVILPQKLDYAVKYVNNRTFLGDLIIIFATLKKLLECVITTS